MNSLTRLSVHDPLKTKEGQVCSSTRIQILYSPKCFDIQRQDSAPLMKVEMEQQLPADVVPLANDIAGPMAQKRKREDRFMRWYERRKNERLEQPPANDVFKELEEGYLFLNWVDNATCQAWVSLNGEEGKICWESIKWGDRRPGSQDRFVVTEKGFPSFVGESTWFKTYKAQKSRTAN